MGDMRPIETEYRGYRFRSRLEARWAVVFDALEIKWTYEPEGFETSAGRYLPDFLLDPGSVIHQSERGYETAGPVYVEVKGAPLRDDEAARIHAFATDPGPERWLLALGEIPDPTSSAVLLCGWGRSRNSDWWLGFRAMSSYTGTWGEPLGPWNLPFYAGHFRHKAVEGGPEFRSRILGVALARGRSARFEHGENPC